MRFGPDPDELAHRPPPFENNQCRNAADIVIHGRSLVVVDIHFADFDGAGVLGREFFNQRRDLPARPAPGSPKIDEHRLSRLENFAIEITIGQFDDVGGRRDCLLALAPRGLPAQAAIFATG